MGGGVQQQDFTAVRKGQGCHTGHPPQRRTQYSGQSRRPPAPHRPRRQNHADSQPQRRARQNAAQQKQDGLFYNFHECLLPRFRVSLIFFMYRRDT